MTKPPYWRTLFGSRVLARVYDLWVWVGTLGQTGTLREKVLDFVPDSPRVLIDLAAGTGEAALLLKRTYPASRVLASDLSEAMLERARKKSERVEWSLQDAVHTTYASSSADFAVISFALHDLPHEQRLGVIKEAHRLLKPGGVFAVYEYHMPQNPLLRLPLFLQFFLVENKEAREIFTEDLQGELKRTGFAKTKKRLYFGGLAQIVAGEK